MVIPDCQPREDNQPMKYDSIFCFDLGANSEIQWYCPPAVGAIEAISPIEMLMKKKKIVTTM